MTQTSGSRVASSSTASSLKVRRDISSGVSADLTVQRTRSDGEDSDIGDFPEGPVRKKRSQPSDTVEEGGSGSAGKVDKGKKAESTQVVRVPRPGGYMSASKSVSQQPEGVCDRCWKKGEQCVVSHQPRVRGGVASCDLCTRFKKTCSNVGKADGEGKEKKGKGSIGRVIVWLRAHEG